MEAVGWSTERLALKRVTEPVGALQGHHHGEQASLAWNKWIILACWKKSFLHVLHYWMPKIILWGTVSVYMNVPHEDLLYMWHLEFSYYVIFTTKKAKHFITRTIYCEKSVLRSCVNTCLKECWKSKQITFTFNRSHLTLLLQKSLYGLTYSRILKRTSIASIWLGNCFLQYLLYIVPIM